MTTQDQVILDDLIVDGSACIGFDCVDGESFGFDTIRLKENNLRIRVQDTSSTASFPSNDWQITFNDSANGGANKFSIDDIDGGLTPFTIEAVAPSHSLYVDDRGRLGLGTSTPVVDIHVKSGNSPVLRLEQDGSSGFTPQTWDVVGNEANFFIRDVTSDSTLPFRISAGGAPSNSLTIAGDGDIGIGTNSPAAMFHIENTSGQDTDDFVVTSAGKVGIGTTSPSSALDVVGGMIVTGSVVQGSDITWKKNVRTIDDALDKVMHLRGVKFDWRRDKFEHLRFSAGTQVGFIAQEVERIIPEVVHTDTEGHKSVAYANITALLIEAVKEQQVEITLLRAQIESLAADVRSTPVQ